MPKIVKIRGNDIDIGFNEGDIAIITQVGRTPVKTGFLRDNFVLDQGAIVNPTPYGEIVERGQGRFMVAKSIPEIAQRLLKRVTDQLDQAELLDLPKSLV